MKILRRTLALALTCTLPLLADTTVPPTTVSSGQTLNVQDAGIVTTSGAVNVQSGGTAILQGGTAVRLTPGFHAATGSFFHAFLSDGDGDGLPDLWEQQYFGNLSASAGNDNDGDGLTNIQEFVLGTAPNNADRTAPSNPAALSASVTGPTQITLTWSGSTDTGAGTPGVAGYKIYRNGAPLNLALVTNSSYTDNGLISQTAFSYTVRAVDLAGNISGDSNTVSATTPANSALSYGNPQAYGFTGSTQNFTVPAGVTNIRAKVWGAGGGAGYDATHTVPNISASPGSYRQMEWTVQPGNVISISVGEAGRAGSSAPATFGGGAAPSQSWSGSGGGRSEVGAPNGVLVAAGGGPGGGAGSGAGGGPSSATGGSGIVSYSNNNPSDLDYSNLAGTAGINGSGGNGRVVLLLGYATAPGSPSITSASTVNFNQYAGSTYQITATNSPLAYEILGTPPPGMTINLASGQITGVPSQCGNYRLIIKAANNSGSDTRELTLTVTGSKTVHFLNTIAFSPPNGSANSYTIPGGLVYDYARMKVWGGGGGSAPPLANGTPGAVGGQGGFAQMDVIVSGGEVVTPWLPYQLGQRGTNGYAASNGSNSGTGYRAGGGLAGTLDMGSSCNLVAGGGGGAGVAANSTTFVGGNGGNGAGANLPGLDGANVVDSQGNIAYGGKGASTTAAGIAGSNFPYYGPGGSGGPTNGNYYQPGSGGSFGYIWWGTGGWTMSTGGQGGWGSYGGASLTFGGGGGGVMTFATTPVRIGTGAGGGGGSGKAVGGFNIIGYQHNNSSDPDWGNSAGAAGDAANNYNGYSGRAVLLLGSVRPAVTSPSTWSITQGVPDSYSITTGLNATAYAVTSGTLPSGLRMDGRSGIISGTPTQAGTFTVSVTANNNNGPYVAFPLSIVVISNMATQQNLPYVTGFEPYEGFTSTSLAGQNGWTIAQGAADITTTLAQRGSNSARLPAAATPAVIRHNFTQGTGSSVVFTDCYVKMTADPTVGVSRLEVGPSWISFLKNGAMGEVMACQSSGAAFGSWQSTGLKYTLNGSNETTAWVRLTVRQDFTAKRWDLYVDGKAALSGLWFVDKTVPGFTQFTLRGHPTGLTLLDSLSITGENPLFTDADRDGMDDNWELAYGLNPTINDRDADKDGDGLLNLQEFFLGSRPNLVDTDGDGFTDAQEVNGGTNPLVAKLNDPTPMIILLTEPINATPVP